jgi:hypothetical protein
VIVIASPADASFADRPAGGPTRRSHRISSSSPAGFVLKNLTTRVKEKRPDPASRQGAGAAMHGGGMALRIDFQLFYHFLL